MKTQYRGFFITTTSCAYTIDGLRGMTFATMELAKAHVDTVQDSLNRSSVSSVIAQGVSMYLRCKSHFDKRADDSNLIRTF